MRDWEPELKQLIESGLLKDGNRQHAIGYSGAIRNVCMLKYIVKHGSGIRLKRTKSGDIRLDFVMLLLRHTYGAYGVMKYAVTHNHIPVIMYLLSKGMTPQYDGGDIIVACIRNRSRAALRLLIDNGWGCH